MIDTTFIDELASKAPTPGGGGACAYCGALAAALSSMVCELTLGKAAYARYEEAVRTIADETASLQDRLIELIDLDARAFAPLAAAYAMPKETPEEQEAKDRAMQEALVEAIEVPLSIMRACARVVELAESLVEKGSRLALSDAGASTLLSKAALQGASLNVFINCSSMVDSDLAQRYRNEAQSLMGEYVPRADRAYETVMKELEA